MPLRFLHRRSTSTGLLLVAPLAFATLAFAPATSFAQNGSAMGASNSIAVTLNGARLNFQGAEPVQIGGRVMVPLRGVFEALGASVDFDSSTQTVFAVRGETQMQLRLGSSQATVNGQERMLDVPAQSRFGRALVPLRFVSEALGANVTWNDASRTVDITAATTPPGQSPFVPPATPPVVSPPVTPPVTTPVTPPVVPPVVAPVTPPVTNEPPPYEAPAAETLVGTVIKTDPAPPATLTLRVDNRVRTVNLTGNAVITRQSATIPPAGAAAAYGAPVVLTDVSRLIPGEEIRVRLDDAGEATQIAASATLTVARVRSTNDTQIILDDARGTTLVIGPTLRFVDARGRLQSTATLTPGQSVALFIAPTTRRVYQVSAAPLDLTYAANPTRNPNQTTNDLPPDNTFPPDTTPTNTFPPTVTNPAADGAPVINLVQHNAIRPLRTQGVFVVTVRGTTGARASFSAVPGAPEQPLVEDPNQPGFYSGTYTVRNGDNILNGRVTAFLRNDAGQEANLQSRTPITIDTVVPRITTTSPTDGATVTSVQPNIVVYANDIGGSGLAKATATINNATVPVESIAVSPTSVSITPLQPLTGQVTVRVNVADAANNSATTTFSFFIDATGAGALITSVTHNANRALAAGERVSAIIAAGEGGRASIDVLGTNGRVVAQGIPATEISPGRYRASYTIQPNTPDAQLLLRARYTAADGRVATADATAPVVLAGDAATPVAITVPLEGDRIASPLVVRGRATPGATVDVSVVATGVRLFVFEYRNDLGTQQVVANARGEWTTAPITLTTPNNVSNLRYTISATQTDAAGRQSQPVSVSVIPR